MFLGIPIALLQIILLEIIRIFRLLVPTVDPSTIVEEISPMSTNNSTRTVAIIQDNA